MTDWRLLELRTTRTLVPQIVLVSDGGQQKIAPLSRVELARLVSDGAKALERLHQADEVRQLRAALDPTPDAP